MKLAFTRIAQADTYELAARLGIELRSYPLIRTDIDPIQPGIIHYFEQNPFDGWIATSKNAARYIKRMALRGTVRLPDAIFAVGASSSAIVEGIGPKIIMPGEANAKSLAEKIRSMYNSGRFCFFKGNLALDTIPRLLSETFDIAEVECYKTTKLQTAIPGDEYDAIAFFSPSAVEAFVEACNKAEQKPIFAIGKTTSNAVAQLLGAEAIVPTRPTAELLLETVKQFCHERYKQ